MWIYQVLKVTTAKIRDHETGLVSGSFSWSQSHQTFLRLTRPKIVLHCGREIKIKVVKNTFVDVLVIELAKGN